MYNNEPMIRLVYASHATFKPFTEVAGVDPHVADILASSRKNNPQQNLFGALYYGSGCFLQCIEGKTQQVEALYQKLSLDPRHERLRILQRQEIDQISFVNWGMKYATLDMQLRQLLRRHKIAKFDPYRFDQQIVTELVELMQHATEQHLLTTS